MKNIILIIGGMGPQASLHLHRLIIEETILRGAINGEDFPAIVHVSLPIKDFISNESLKEEALRQLDDCLSIYRDVAFSNVIIACNTAHLLQKQIEEILNKPVTSLLTTVQEHCDLNMYKKVGLLASPVTIKTKIYHQHLSNFRIVTLNKQERLKTESIIRSVIAGKSNICEPLLLNQINELNQKGCDTVILGCTELSVVIQDSNLPTATVDPLHLIAKKITGN